MKTPSYTNYVITLIILYVYFMSIRIEVRFNQTDQSIIDVFKQTKILTEKINFENPEDPQNSWINVEMELIGKHY